MPLIIPQHVGQCGIRIHEYVRMYVCTLVGGLAPIDTIEVRGISCGFQFYNQVSVHHFNTAYMCVSVVWNWE